MIKHILLWDPVSPAALQQLTAKMEKLRSHPLMRRLEYGQTLRSDPARYQLAVIMSFDRPADLQSFREDSTHLAVAGDIGALVKSWQVVDFQDS